MFWSSTLGGMGLASPFLRLVGFLGKAAQASGLFHLIVFSLLFLFPSQ